MLVKRMSTRSSVKFERLRSQSNATETFYEEEPEEASNRVQLEVSGVMFLIQATCCSLVIFSTKSVVSNKLNREKIKQVAKFFTGKLGTA